jgi:hypothetical protein
MKKYAAAAFICTVLFGSTSAFADEVISFSAFDNIYGSQSGATSSGATGSADTLNFDASVAGAEFTVDLTTAGGIVTDTIFSPAPLGGAIFAGDSFEFDGVNSGNAAIGTTCAASATVACVVNTGGVLDLTSIFVNFSNFNAYSIFGGEITVQATPAASPVPEPSPLMLLGTGIAGAFGMARRRFIRAA